VFSKQSYRWDGFPPLKKQANRIIAKQVGFKAANKACFVFHTLPAATSEPQHMFPRLNAHSFQLRLELITLLSRCFFDHGDRLNLDCMTVFDNFITEIL